MSLIDDDGAPAATYLIRDDKVPLQVEALASSLAITESTSVSSSKGGATSPGLGQVDGAINFAAIIERLATLERRIATLEERLADLEEAPQGLRSKTESQSTDDVETPSLVDSTEDARETVSYEIANIDGRVVQAGSTTTTIAYKFDVINSSDVGLILSAQIKFLDEDDFVVAEDFETNIFVEANATQTFSSQRILLNEVADEIAGIAVETTVISTE